MTTRKRLLNWLHTKYLKKGLRVKCLTKCTRDEDQVFANVFSIKLIGLYHNVV